MKRLRDCFLPFYLHDVPYWEDSIGASWENNKEKPIINVIVKYDYGKLKRLVDELGLRNIEKTRYERNNERI